MPILDWDAPADEIFSNLPHRISFRIAAHRMGLVLGWQELSKRIKPVYPECSPSLLAAATAPLRKGNNIRPCPRCGRKTTSQRYCSTCQIEQVGGILSTRERARLREHYALAAQQYADNREREHQYSDDAYTRGG